MVEEIGKVGKTWKEVRTLAQNKIHWRCFVEPYAPEGVKGDKSSKSIPCRIHCCR
jgi:hypothetical protein